MFVLPAFVIRDLRIKLLALVAPLISVVGIGLLAVFWFMAQDLIDDLGSRLSTNQVLLDRTRASDPLPHEITLAESLVTTPSFLAWARSSDDPALRPEGIATLERYRELFSSGSYFFVHDASKTFYYNDGSLTDQENRATYTVSEREIDDAWYFSTLELPGICHLNVDYDRALKTTKVWFNCNVRDPLDGRNLGVVGTGIDLTDFIDELQRNQTPGVTVVFTDANGVIQAHPDISLIEHDALTKPSNLENSILNIVDRTEDRNRLSNAIAALQQNPDRAATADVLIDGKRHLIGVAYVPRLNWISVSVMDAQKLVLGHYFTPLAILIAAGVLLSLLVLVLALRVLVFHRVFALEKEVTAFKDDNTMVLVDAPDHSDDQLGRLSHSFHEMARTVRLNTQELELKNRFLGMAAHELRNPIGVVHGMSEMILKKDATHKQREEFLTSIHEVSDQMLSMLSDLLDVTAIESGRFLLAKEPGDVAELVEARIRILAVAARNKGTQIAFHAEGSPEACFDQQRMVQVVDNLLTNALKFSPPNSLIDVYLRPAGEAVELEVRDYGQGIPTVEQDRLFRPFEKLTPQPTAGEQSTGLGLAIVKRIVDAHSGTVAVRSKAGEGSSFTVTLPRQADLTPAD